MEDDIPYNPYDASSVPQIESHRWDEMDPTELSEQLVIMYDRLYTLTNCHTDPNTINQFKQYINVLKSKLEQTS